MSGPIEFSNGRDTVKIYTTTVRGKPFYQLAFYRAGRRERRTFSDRAEAKREGKLVLTQLASGAKETEAAVTTPEVESLIAARKALDGIDCPLHVAVESFAKSIKTLGSPDDPLAILNDAVTFYRKHNPVGAERVPLKELTQRFLDSRKRRGLSTAYTSSVEIAMKTFLEGFPKATELPTGDEVVRWLERKFTSPRDPEHQSPHPEDNGALGEEAARHPGGGEGVVRDHAFMKDI